MGLSVGGLISGLDVDSIVSGLSDIERQPIVQLQQKEADYLVKLSAYGTMQSSLNALKSAMENLDSGSEFDCFSAASGNEDLFTVSANSSAAPGSYDIEAIQLAQAHKMATSGAFSEEEAIGEGTLRIQAGDGEAVEISVSATDTIADIAQAINDADAGIHAGLINDGTGYYLTLEAEETGVSNAINCEVTDADGNPEDDTGLSRLTYGSQALIQTREPLGSIIRIDGLIEINRDTNTFDDVIEGVTFTLQSAPGSPDNATTLTVERNTSGIVSKINAFVTAYNELVDFFESYQNFDPDSENTGVLLGDRTANLVRNNLRNLIGFTVSGTDGFNNLSDIGIAINDENHLEADSGELNEALSNNFDEVVQFFARNEESTEGFAVHMADALDAFLDSHDGIIAARQEGIQNSIDDIDDQIDRIETRVQAYEERTRSRFEALEVLLAQYQSISDYLTQQIESLSNLNQYISNKGK
jgi:flagellar hook-associated protein 2